MSPPRIRLFDTPDLLRDARPEIDEAISSVLDSGRFILGPEVEAFERELAAYVGVPYAIGVANGTDALVIALRALGIGPGDDVVVPSFTFYATAEVVPHVGARPVFCDIDPETFCMTAETVARALTPATKAVIAVHLFGTPAPLVELSALTRSRGIKLIEDAAQAAGAELDGARVGALGDAATLSFFPSKNLPCLGDGGAILTPDAQVAERVRLLRLHGSVNKEVYEDVGYNSRLDAVQAAVLRVLLPRLDGWNERRRALASAYVAAGLDDLVRTPKAPPNAKPVHHLYVVRSERRDTFARQLAQAGIESRALYEVPIHRQPAMARYAGDLELPGTNEAAATNLALPMGPTRHEEVAGDVVEQMRLAL